MTADFPQDARSSMAQRLLIAAEALGRAIRDVESIERLDRTFLVNVGPGQEADLVVIDGAEVAKALRSLATRLDRGAIIERDKVRDAATA